MSVRAGREFLAIPGPTTVPDEVLRAMHRPAVDIYSGPLLQLTDSLAVLAGGVAKHYRALGLLSILPLELPKMLRPVGMIWSRQRPLSPSTRLMMSCLEEATHSDLLLQSGPPTESQAAPRGVQSRQPVAEPA